MSDFIPTPIQRTIDISHIVTIHDFIYTPDFLFTGESHDFWELVYVKSGSIGVMAGSTGYTMNSGEVIFHLPGEYHNVWANGSAAEVIILTFISNSPAMRFFERRMFMLGKDEIALIEKLLDYSRTLLEGPLDFLYQKELSFRPNVKSSEKQLIKNYIEDLLLMIMESDGVIDRKERISESAGNRNGLLITNSIIRELTENVCGNITLDDVCSDVAFSKSHLKTLFKKNTGYSIMDYYTHLKIERAKILIDESNMLFSDIAELLGFSSIHYFSRVFRKKVGMSPTEYKMRNGEADEKV